MHIALHCDRRCDSLAAPSEEGASRIRILEFENRVNYPFTRVSISMKRYAAVKVRGGQRPRSRMLEGAGPVGPVLLELMTIGLPRKEVIQPHVPVRLPCYDFTPLTLHTFDASAP